MTSHASVRSTFNYTRDTGVTPEIYFYEPLPGTQTHQPGDDPREMPVHDGWDRGEVLFAEPRGLCAARIPLLVSGLGQRRRDRRGFMAR